MLYTYNVLLFGKDDQSDLSYFVNILVSATSSDEAEHIALDEAALKNMKHIKVEELKVVTHLAQQSTRGVIETSGHVYFHE